MTALEAMGFAHDQIAGFFLRSVEVHASGGSGDDPAPPDTALRAGGKGHSDAAVELLAMSREDLEAALAAITIDSQVLPCVGPYTGPYGDALDRLESARESVRPSTESDLCAIVEAAGDRGIGIAVRAVTAWDQACAITILQGQGATGLMQSWGKIAHGQWIDYDPLAARSSVGEGD
ncbi:MAG: hypothetical protein ABI724_06500 [Betaproteobacteria bacterium]